jgi:transcriptional regulator with XRE-family HTH domain
MWRFLHTIDSFAFIFLKMGKKEILVAFGDKVRELRKEKGISQEELSYKADLHRTYIGMIERAEKNLTLTNIEKIAKALDVDIKSLF